MIIPTAKKGNIMKNLIVLLFTLFVSLCSPNLLASNENSEVLSGPEESVKLVEQTMNEPVSPSKEDKYQGIDITVNINTATLEELSALLLGVGDKKAQRIIEYREKHGEFTSVEDLMRVKGIGPSIVEKNRQRVLL
jgi:competence protein ComEA